MYKENLLELNNITGLILTGGAGRRVGGKDKGLLEYKGTPLIETQIGWLKTQVSHVLISANRNIEQFHRFGYPVLQDGCVSREGRCDKKLKQIEFEKSNQFGGPLYGVLAGLSKCVNDYLFVLPVDVPNLPINLIEKMCQEINQKKLSKVTNCFYLKTREREHYLSMLIHKKAFVALREFLESGEKRVRDFHLKQNSLSLDIGLDEKQFKNLNWEGDY